MLTLEVNVDETVVLASDKDTGSMVDIASEISISPSTVLG